MIRPEMKIVPPKRCYNDVFLRRALNAGHHTLGMNWCRKKERPKVKTTNNKRFPRYPFNEFIGSHWENLEELPFLKSLNFKLTNF